MATEKDIGENLKRYEAKQRLSPEDFAEKSRAEYTTPTKMESGVGKKPSALVVAKITAASGAKVGELKN